MKRRQMLKRNAGKILTTLVVACVTVTACGDKDKKQPVSVSISFDAPFELQPGLIDYHTTVDNAWFKHMLTVENTSNRSISIFGDVSEQFIGENKLLVLNDQCAPSPPAPGGRLPTIVCTSAKSLPIEVEPHASAELRTIYVFKGLEGMPSLTSGKYTADASIVWKYADESENHTSTAQIVYSVK